MNSLKTIVYDITNKPFIDKTRSEKIDFAIFIVSICIIIMFVFDLLKKFNIFKDDFSYLLILIILLLLAYLFYENLITENEDFEYYKDFINHYNHYNRYNKDNMERKYVAYKNIPIVESYDHEQEHLVYERFENIKEEKPKQNPKTLHKLNISNRVFDTNHWKNQILEPIHTETEIKKPVELFNVNDVFENNDKESDSYYHEITGQPRFKKQIKPEYFIRSKIDATSFGDSYGSFANQPSFNKKDIRGKANGHWLESSIQFREEMSERLMAKRNRELKQMKKYKTVSL